MKKVTCCECGRSAKRYIAIIQNVDLTEQRVCLPCWHRLGFDDFFSDKFKKNAVRMLAA